MTNKMEAECKALLLSVLGTFTFTGPKANWPFVANSYIDTRNLPTTNDVPVTYCHGAMGDTTFGTPGTQIGAFDYPVLDEIINYAKLIDAIRLPGTGEFRPRASSFACRQRTSEISAPMPPAATTRQRPTCRARSRRAADRNL